MIETAALLSERQRTHGDFDQVAALTSVLQSALATQPHWADLSVRQREALRMIMVKAARLVCGDPGHPGHWEDIAGYAALGAGGEAA